MNSFGPKGSHAPGKGLFPTDAIFRAVFDGLTDIFVCITIQGTNLHIACVIDQIGRAHV